MFIFISGEERSGKSYYAEKRLSELSGSPKIYIAAAKIYDDEMRERVKNHQEMRKDKGFITIECPCNLGSVKIPKDSAVLIESLTLWTANEMFTDDGIKPCNYVISKIYHDFMNIFERSCNIILVADDIFSDGIKYSSETEKYIRLIAEMHIKFASIADEVIECVSGLYIAYKNKL